MAHAFLVVASLAHPLDHHRYHPTNRQLQDAPVLVDDPLEISLAEKDIIDIAFNDLLIKKTISQTRPNQVMRITFDNQVHKSLINSQTDALVVVLTE